MSDKLAVIQGQKTVEELKKIEAEGRKVVRMFKDMVTQTNLVNRSLNTGRLREFNAALQELNRTTQQHTTLERQLAAAMERTARLEREQARLATEQARTRRELAAAEREESRARQQATREAASNARQTRENSSAHAQFTRQVREARQRARDYGAEIRNLRERLRDGTITQREYNQQYPELVRNFRNARTEAIRLERQLHSLNQSTLPAGQRNGGLKGRITDILKAVGIVNVVDNVASSFFRLGEKAIETSRKLDTLRLAQRSVFKTNDEVNLQNDFLSKTANRYGIEILGLSDAYTKFAASAQGTYLEGQRSQTIFDAVSKSSAMLGVSTDDTTGILRALGQMMSKGKVQAEELRGQLGDRMAGAFKLFADGMGVSTAQLDKMLKDGEVLADDVLPKFAEQLNKKYTLGIGEEIQTQTAATNRAANAWVAFVDGVENGSGIMSKSVIGFSTALTRMLEALTPNKAVTVIEKEQAQLNLLGIELRHNINDEKKRKEILDEIIKINPFFQQGLDKEHLTLEGISNQLRNVNDQYTKKIALEQQSEHLKELNADLAQSYRYLSKIFVDNAEDYNNLNEATKKVLDEFRYGALGYFDAQKKIEKNTKAFSKENRTATDILFQMNSIIAQGSLNFDGFNRGIDGNKIAIRNATAEYDSLVNMFDKMIGKQKQLVFMNGLTAKSFDGMGKEQVDRYKEANEIIQKATLSGQKFALVRNVWRAQNEKGGWFTTNKKADDWYLEEGKLLQRQKSKGLPEKPKTYTGAKLDGRQKDVIMDAQGLRDNQIADLKNRRLDLLVGEEEYWKEYRKIIADYSDKISGFLTGKNAKERQIEGKERKRAVDAREQANKEVFDIDSRNLEENFKKRSNVLERQTKKLEDDTSLSAVQRLNSQIAVDTELLLETEKFYDEQIKIAEAAAQPIIELERKKAEEIGKIQDDRNKRSTDLSEAYGKMFETFANTNKSLSDSSIEEQKQLIMANKKLSIAERTYQLSQLEKDATIKTNELEIQRLKIEQGRVMANKLIRALKGGSPAETAEEAAQIADLQAQIDALLTGIKQAKGEKRNEEKDRWKQVADEGLEGLKALGFDNLAETIGKNFDDLYEKISTGALTAKDAALLAASAIADGLSSMIDRQKEHTISALDEQLKFSQESADQETKILEGRLEQLNNIENLTAEQMAERARLEDEARVVKEQQLQREKMIETQKAKAEQKAASQQALINGALGATQALASMPPPASFVMAGLALAFGIAQSVAIMSKDPTPKYWKGRKGGKAEYAWTQEKGAELITDKNDNIKSLGSGSGAKMTWLESGDKVFTAEESKNILKSMGPNSKIGNRLVKRSIQQSLQTPIVNVSVNQSASNNGKKLESAVRKAFKDFGPTSIRKEKGMIIKEKPGYISKVVGKYDLKTGEETWI